MIKFFGHDLGTNPGTNMSAGFVILRRYQSTVSGVLSEIRVRPVTNVNIKTGIYNDSGGSVGTRLSYCGSQSLTGGIINTISMPSVNIISGTYYWVAYVLQSSSRMRYYTGTVVAHKYKSVTYDSFEFPESLTGLSDSDEIYDHAVAVWGTEAAAGCPRQAMYYKMMG